MSPFFGAKRPLRGSGSLPATVFHPRVFTSAGEFAIHNQRQRLARTVLMISATFADFQHSSSMLSQSPHQQKANTLRHSFLAATSHRRQGSSRLSTAARRTFMRP